MPPRISISSCFSAILEGFSWMANRPTIPMDTQRQLWAESMGRCMNPTCSTDLFPNGVSIGEVAHITPHAASGSVSLTNLLILCANCHTAIDKNRKRWPEQVLLGWKAQRSNDVNRHFATRYSSFEELEKAIKPILVRNRQIFDSYGPDGEHESDDYRRQLWLQFEPELIANNQRIIVLLDANIRLIQKENQGIVDVFKQHAAEFLQTRGNEPQARINLFPRELTAIFGVGSPDEYSSLSNLSALQNLLNHLVKSELLVEFQLTPEPLLRYRQGGKVLRMDLGNRPRMQQIFFSGRFFRPQTTEVRMKDLLYVVGRLDRLGIPYAWPELTRLIEIRVAEKYDVLFCYKYYMSQIDEVELAYRNNIIVVNLYGWNNDEINENAVKSTSTTGVHYLNQKEFFEFIRREFQ